MSRKATCRQMVDPSVFAECMISHDRLERVNYPEDDLLGLRNPQTGETLYVQGSSLRTWMRGH